MCLTVTPPNVTAGMLIRDQWGLSHGLPPCAGRPTFLSARQVSRLSVSLENSRRIDLLDCEAAAAAIDWRRPFRRGATRSGSLRGDLALRLTHSGLKSRWSRPRRNQHSKEADPPPEKQRLLPSVCSLQLLAPGRNMCFLQTKPRTSGFSRG